MGDVVSLDAARVFKTLDTSFIDDAYAALEKLPDFKARPGQRQLSIKIFEALTSGKPLAAEAPTGTGKTVSYLVAALAAQKSRPEATLMPIVIATATIGLQEQVMTGDLPKLHRAGLISSTDCVVAKGRGRYLCILSADRIANHANAEGQFDFFDPKQNDATAAFDTAKGMLEDFSNESWNGQLDHYNGAFKPTPQVWSRLGASADTCIQKRCQFFETCPFFQDRARMMKAKVIIANHDLVLADLKMALNGDQQPLFPEDKYLLIFDEAHNLPDKALNAGSAELNFELAQQSLLPLPAFATKLFKEPRIAKLLHNKEINATDFEPGPAIKALADAAAYIRTLPTDDPEVGIISLGGEVLTDGLERVLNIAHGQLIGLQGRFQNAATALRHSKLPEKDPSMNGYFAEALFQASYLGTRLREICSAFSVFLSETRGVRWLDHTPAYVKIHKSPLEGADLLRTVLWESDRAVPVLISATLKTFGNFERFRARSGLPIYAQTYTAEPIFRYEDSDLVVATKMVYSPKYSERAKWENELCDVLPQFIRNNESTLVLLPSQKMLKLLVPALRKHFGKAVLAQRDMPFTRLVQTHRERTDEGKTSILCGLATMAEGLDLPGQYCTHVVIVALPFAVPTSPVEKELQNVMGGAVYFKDRCLPDSQMHLVQMVGRLIRRESDVGRITVMDKRLWQAWWGRKMLKGLPAFHKREEQLGDRQPPRGVTLQ